MIKTLSRHPETPRVTVINSVVVDHSFSDVAIASLVSDLTNGLEQDSEESWDDVLNRIREVNDGKLYPSDSIHHSHES